MVLSSFLLWLSPPAILPGGCLYALGGCHGPRPLVASRLLLQYECRAVRAPCARHGRRPKPSVVLLYALEGCHNIFGEQYDIGVKTAAAAQTDAAQETADAA